MKWNALNALLAAGAPAEMVPNEKAKNAQMIGMMLVMGFVMYFIMIRPQRQRQKQLDLLLKSIKPGDKVLTGSGIVGVVLTVREKTVTLRSGETKLEVLKSSVSDITEKSGEAAPVEPIKN